MKRNSNGEHSEVPSEPNSAEKKLKEKWQAHRQSENHGCLTKLLGIWLLAFVSFLLAVTANDDGAYVVPFSAFVAFFAFLIMALMAVNSTVIAITNYNNIDEFFSTVAFLLPIITFLIVILTFSLG